MRLYNPLFAKPDPDAGNFAADLNPSSLEVIADARVEPSLAGGNSGAAVQFERLGYFCPDKDPPRRLVRCSIAPSGCGIVTLKVAAS